MSRQAAPGAPRPSPRRWGQTVELLPPLSSAKARPFGLCCLSLTALLVGAVGLAAFLAWPRSPSSMANTAHTSCSPAPCAELRGMVVQVTKIDRNVAPGEEPGQHFVAVYVRFHNQRPAGAVQADPLEFALEDQTGRQHPLDFLPYVSQCGGWQRTAVPPDSYLTGYAMCFQAAGPTNGRLKLIWNPRMAEGDVVIPLR